MSDKEIVIDNETGEVMGGDYTNISGVTGETLAALVPYNRMTHIAKTALLRAEWDKKKGVWITDMGESSTLTGEMVKATEIYACWSSQVGKPDCMGFGPICPQHPDKSEMGYRLAIDSEEFGNVYVDLFGLAQRVGAAACKYAVANNDKIAFDGSKAINTQNGTFYIPKIVR